jgi:hypothetical protein
MCKCTALSPTLGQLVSLAYDRNQALIDQSDAGCTIDADLVSMRQLLLHSAMWTRLQDTFFSPGIEVLVLPHLRHPLPNAALSAPPVALCNGLASNINYTQ